MDDKADKPKRRWPTYLSIVLVLVFVVYPLSIGPAHVIYMRSENDDVEMAFATLYTPLFVFANATGMSPAFMVYINWWMSVADRLLSR